MNNNRFKFVGIIFIVIGAVSLYFSPVLSFPRESSDDVYVRDIPLKNNEIDEKEEAPIVPIRIVIPAISVDAHVEHVGVGSNGHMQVPRRYENTAWYARGFFPGEAGSAVIAGHIDNSLGRAGVFISLEDLEVGDDIFVYDEQGNNLHFKVESYERYHYLQAPLDRIFGPRDESYLNLITCVGEWLTSARSYEERLVVYTRLVN
jgi:sortase A